MDNNNEDKSLNFINKNIGIDAWVTLSCFQINSLTTIKQIEMSEQFWNISNINSNELSQDEIRIYQQFMLDIISKIEIIIESLLVLIHELSKGYDNLSIKMTYYRPEILQDIIKEMFINNNYNKNRAFAIPTFTGLSLENEERTFLENDYNNLKNLLHNNLEKLSKFYNQFRMIYGKTKHGLTYMSGTQSEGSNNSFFNSSLYGFTRIDDSKTSNDFVKSKITSSEPPIKIKFFNVISYIKFDKKLIDNIQKIIITLKEIIMLVCNNHLLFAVNRGNGFLLFSERDNQRSMVTSQEYKGEKEIKIIASIAKKNLLKFYSPKTFTTTNLQFDNDEINSNLNENSICNILFI